MDFPPACCPATPEPAHGQAKAEALLEDRKAGKTAVIEKFKKDFGIGKKPYRRGQRGEEAIIYFKTKDILSRTKIFKLAHRKRSGDAAAGVK